ncbi:hypothetical protein C8J56DRAFT_902616 [Mycena floridula]|nr:hypothetical protein C8J56DRAFT_902616 [Mycena floridula]
MKPKKTPTTKGRKPKTSPAIVPDSPPPSPPPPPPPLPTSLSPPPPSPTPLSPLPPLSPPPALYPFSAPPALPAHLIFDEFEALEIGAEMRADWSYTPIMKSAFNAFRNHGLGAFFIPTDEFDDGLSNEGCNYLMGVGNLNPVFELSPSLIQSIRTIRQNEPVLPESPTCIWDWSLDQFNILMLQDIKDNFVEPTAFDRDFIQYLELEDDKRFTYTDTNADYFLEVGLNFNAEFTLSSALIRFLVDYDGSVEHGTWSHQHFMRQVEIHGSVETWAKSSFVACSKFTNLSKGKRRSEYDLDAEMQMLDLKMKQVDSNMSIITQKSPGGVDNEKRSRSPSAGLDWGSPPVVKHRQVLAPVVELSSLPSELPPMMGPVCAPKRAIYGRSSFKGTPPG